MNYWENDEAGEKQESRDNPLKMLILRTTAFIVLLAFVFMAFPNLTHLLSGQFSLLKQNDELKSDAVVVSALPAVVSIQAVQTALLDNSGRKGTGFNLLPSGLILSNYHVVENADRVKVKFADGQVYFSNRVYRVDDYDLALIVLEGYDLPVIELDTEHPVSSGDSVFVIGNPGGYERFSQKGPVNILYTGQEGHLKYFDIEVTALPGSSGSPVLNEDGKAVGIIFASIHSQENQRDGNRAIAIPVITVNPELQKAIAGIEEK